MEPMQTIWGWQPALYLFLGGVGAGAFVAAGVFVLTDREGSRSVAGASMWAALGCLGIGLLQLLDHVDGGALVVRVETVSRFLIDAVRFQEPHPVIQPQRFFGDAVQFCELARS